MKGPLSATSGFAIGRVPRWYLHHSLLALEKSLDGLGITLIIRRVEEPIHTVDQVVAVTSALQAGAVFWNKRCKPNVYPVDDAVRERLSQHDVYVEDFLSETLLPFPKTGAFDDFQSYTKFCIHSLRVSLPPRPSAALVKSNINCLQRSRIQSVLSLREPEYLRHSPTPFSLSSVLPNVEDLDLLRGLKLHGIYEPGKVSAIGCVAAMETLKAFLAVDKFMMFSENDARRDGMVVGDELATSRLSPHIRFGEISPRVLFYSVIDAGAKCSLIGNESGLCAARTFIKNVTLREFGYYMLARYPCAAYKPIVPEFNVFPWMNDKDGVLRQSWERGTTGFPIVDAAMRQLYREGWLHNKMRFLVASFFVKYLLLPWPVGAGYLVRALIDGDEACNSLGWQWTAGCNSDCFPFSTLINPISYSSHTRSVHRASRYVRKYVPELAHLPDHLLFTPWKATNEEKLQYDLTLLPIGQYRNRTNNCMPPMNEHLRNINGVYPMRIVDVKIARGRSRDAMYLMRRIFSAQRQMYTIMDEQSSDFIDRTTYTEHMGRKSRYIRNSKMVDADGVEVNEIDLTFHAAAAATDDDTLSDVTDASLDQTPSPRLQPVLKKRCSDSNGVSAGRKSKKSKTQQQELQGHPSTNCDLLALCEVVNQRGTRNSPPKQHTVKNSSDTNMVDSTVANGNPPALTSRRSGGGSNGGVRVKRPRRSMGKASGNGKEGRVIPVESLLTNNVNVDNNNNGPSREDEDIANIDEGRPTTAQVESGITQLAQVASVQQPMAPSYCPAFEVAQNDWRNDKSMNGTYNTFHGDGMVPFSTANLQQQQNGDGGSTTIVPNVYQGMTPITATGAPMVPNSYASFTAAVTAAAGTPQAPQPMFIPSYHRQHHPGNDMNNGGPPTAAFTHMPSPPPASHQQQQLGPPPPQQHPPPQHLGPQAYFTGPNGAQPFILYPTMQPYVDMRTGLPTSATPGIMPTMLHPLTGMPMSPYGNGSTSTAVAAAAAMCGYGQAGVGGNGHSSLSHPQVLPPPAGSDGACVSQQQLQQLQLQHHHHVQQHQSLVHHQQAQHQHHQNVSLTMGAGNLMANTIRPAPHSHHSQIHQHHQQHQLQHQAMMLGSNGPSTPMERQAIARRMAAMDYHDETYGGKHWEQWQAITLHLLNCYEFSDDTNRETSRAYVRLCLLKDELRETNPAGPRVTVNHCKEVFKILRLPVTGEWDRRGHGGVRGPYVYGCCKRCSSNVTTSAARNN